MRSGRGQVLAGLMLVIALTAMDSAIVATVIPPIVNDLGGFSLFPWLFSVYLLAQAASVPVYGRLADLYGRKPVLLAGVLIFLAGSVLCGISWNMVALIAFRGLQGLGAGAILPAALTVVGDLYTVVERARIQGWLSSVWGVSAVIGPALGGQAVPADRLPRHRARRRGADGAGRAAVGWAATRAAPQRERTCVPWAWATTTSPDR
jgi:MFS family permease